MYTRNNVHSVYYIHMHTYNMRRIHTRKRNTIYIGNICIVK